MVGRPMHVRRHSGAALTGSQAGSKSDLAYTSRNNISLIKTLTGTQAPEDQTRVQPRVPAQRPLASGVMSLISKGS